MQSRNDGDILKHELRVVPPDAADTRAPAEPSTKHIKKPTIAAIRRSLAEWPDYLQQEGQSLYLVTLRSAAHTTPPSELGRAELRRLYRWFKRQVASKAADFDDELPILIGMLTDSKVEWPDEPGCRALLGVPLGDMSVAVVTDTLASYQSTTGVMVTCRVLTCSDRPLLSHAMAELAPLSKKDRFIRPKDREEVIDGMPFISVHQSSEPLPSLLSIQWGFDQLLKTYSEAIRKGNILSFYPFGRYPAMVLAILPATDVIDYALNNGTKRNDGLGPVNRRKPGIDLLRRASLVIPKICTETTMLGEASFVMQDLHRLFAQVAARVAQADPASTEAFLRHMEPLVQREGFVVCSRPTSIGHPLLGSLED